MRSSDWSSDVCSSDLVVIGQRADLFQRRIGGQPRAGIGGGQRGIEVADIDQAALVGHQHMAGVAAVGENADRLLGAGAEMLGAVAAGRAGDRKSVVTGKSVSVRVDLGGRRIIKKTKTEGNK